MFWVSPVYGDIHIQGRVVVRVHGLSLDVLEYKDTRLGVHGLSWMAVIGVQDMVGSIQELQDTSSCTRTGFLHILARAVIAPLARPARV